MRTSFVAMSDQLVLAELSEEKDCGEGAQAAEGAA